MIAVGRVTDFTCVVFEDGSAGDCEVVPLDRDEPWAIELPG
jgi:hypothetical protein